ncbi:hypothetical protein CLCR_09319 [Cladophialophora carrionii]|uniref:Uncharacterized protein n=1 Tax=Cladophialophora carrionii TaxID=86049 RepID=A0A1C1CT35_9EURO|nr:hypothetical protein CLCR_09319 [Cladophialophora carrionii]
MIVMELAAAFHNLRYAGDELHFGLPMNCSWLRRHCEDCGSPQDQLYHGNFATTSEAPTTNSGALTSSTIQRSSGLDLESYAGCWRDFLQEAGPLRPATALLRTSA